MEDGTKYRCLNDLFAYCKDKPKEGKATTQSLVGLGNGCTKDIETCGCYIKWATLCPPIEQKSKSK